MHKRSPERGHAEIVGNIGHVYCMVAIGLLDRQLATLARAFTENGEFGERLYRLRKQARDDAGQRPKGPESTEGPEPPTP